jgi:hypothetical protein
MQAVKPKKSTKTSNNVVDLGDAQALRPRLTMTLAATADQELVDNLKTSSLMRYTAVNLYFGMVGSFEMTDILDIFGEDRKHQWKSLIFIRVKHESVKTEIQIESSRAVI